MADRQFYTGLGLTTIVALALLMGLRFIFPESVIWSFSLSLTFIFIILTLTMYVFGKKAAEDHNPNKFSRTFLLFTFAKIVVLILMILIFEKLNTSDQRWHLLSFILIYVTFTVYETIIFMRLSRASGDGVQSSTQD